MGWSVIFELILFHSNRFSWRSERSNRFVHWISKAPPDPGSRLLLSGRYPTQHKFPLYYGTPETALPRLQSRFRDVEVGCLPWWSKQRKLQLQVVGLQVSSLDTCWYYIFIKLINLRRSEPGPLHVDKGIASIVGYNCSRMNVNNIIYYVEWHESKDVTQ